MPRTIKKEDLQVIVKDMEVYLLLKGYLEKDRLGNVSAVHSFMKHKETKIYQNLNVVLSALRSVKNNKEGRELQELISQYDEDIVQNMVNEFNKLKAEYNLN